MKKFLALLLASFFVISHSYSQAVNDSCGSASPISIPAGGTSCTNGTTVGGSTITWTTPSCGQTNWPNSVWYTFVATGTLNVISVTPSGTPAAQTLGLNVFTGTCNNLAGGIGSCEISATAGGSDTVTYPSTPGTIFYVQVSSFGTAGGFDICISSTTPPAAPGNTCGTAAHLCSLASFTVGTVPAGGSSFTPSCFGSTPDAGQWYQFTVGVTGQLAWKCKPTAAHIELDWAFYNITNGCPTAADAANYTMCNYNYSGSHSNPIGMSPTAAAGHCPDSTITNNAAREICPWETVVAGQTYAIFINNYSYSPPPLLAGVTGWTFNFDSSTFQMAPVDTFLVNSIRLATITF